MTWLFVLGVCVVSSDNEPNWGEPVSGVVSRLSLVTATPAVGQPLRLKLEVRNTGAQPATYDSQQSTVNGSLIVTGPDGAAIPHIGGSFQTSGQAITLKPGETKEIFADLNAVDQYLIEAPGEYSFQSRARGRVPASNVLKVQVSAGKLSDDQRLFAALHRITPKGWRAAKYGDSIVFLSTPTNLKADAASISLNFVQGPTGGYKNVPGRPAAINLGNTTLGEAWLLPASQAAITRWPDFAKVIGEQVSRFKK